MSGFLPQSEADLQRTLPGSNTPGALARSALLGGEKVIYEDHPRALGLHPVMFWVALPIALFFGAVIAAGVASTSGSEVYVLGVFGTVLLVLPPVAVMVYAVTSPRRTTYALTDQRVILQSGDESVSIPYVQLGNVSVQGRSSRVAFEIKTGSPAPKSRFFGGSTPSLIWKAVRNAPAVAAYAQSASQYYRLRLQQTQIRQDLIKASLEDKVFCQYCGGFVLLSQLNASDPRCPRCYAPIVVAPLGVY